MDSRPASTMETNNHPDAKTAAPQCTGGNELGRGVIEGTPQFQSSTDGLVEENMRTWPGTEERATRPNVCVKEGMNGGETVLGVPSEVEEPANEPSLSEPQAASSPSISQSTTQIGGSSQDAPSADLGSDGAAASGGLLSNSGGKVEKSAGAAITSEGLLSNADGKESSAAGAAIASESVSSSTDGKESSAARAAMVWEDLCGNAVGKEKDATGAGAVPEGLLNTTDGSRSSTAGPTTPVLQDADSGSAPFVDSEGTLSASELAPCGDGSEGKTRRKPRWTTEKKMEVKAAKEMARQSGAMYPQKPADVQDGIASTCTLAEARPGPTPHGTDSGRSPSSRSGFAPYISEEPGAMMPANHIVPASALLSAAGYQQFGSGRATVRGRRRSQQGQEALPRGSDCLGRFILSGVS